MNIFKGLCDTPMPQLKNPGTATAVCRCSLSVKCVGHLIISTLGSSRSIFRMALPDPVATRLCQMAHE